MTIKFGYNGLGIIGRMSIRSLVENKILNILVSLIYVDREKLGLKSWPIKSNSCLHSWIRKVNERSIFPLSLHINELIERSLSKSFPLIGKRGKTYCDIVACLDIFVFTPDKV